MMGLAKNLRTMRARASSSPRNTKRTLSAVLWAAYAVELYPERPFSRRVPAHAERRPREVRAVRVCQTYTDGGGLSPLTKNEHSARVVPVSHLVADELWRRLGEALRGARAAAGDEVGREDVGEWLRARDAASEALLASRIVPLRGDVLYHRWRRELEARGLRYTPPSHLRHASDTIALQSGVSPDLNDKMHGRAGHSATYEHYYRPSLGAMDEAARAVAERMRGGAQGGPDYAGAATLGRPSPNGRPTA